MNTDEQVQKVSKHIPVWNVRMFNLTQNGRPRKFTADQLLQGAMNYFEHCNNNPIQVSEIIKGGNNAGKLTTRPVKQMFMIEGLCVYLGINTKYLAQMLDNIKDRTDEESDRLTNVIKYIHDCIRLQRVTLAAANELNPLIVSRIEGLKDSVEHSGEVKNTNTIIFDFTNIPKNIEDCEGVDVTELMKKLTSDTL